MKEYLSMEMEYVCFDWKQNNVMNLEFYIKENSFMKEAALVETNRQMRKTYLQMLNVFFSI